MSKYISHSPEETKQIATKILNDHWPAKRQGALVLALVGELGAGKTNFTQGIAEYAGIKRNITSPTFVIMKRYDVALENPSTARVRGLSRIYHFDCYRINTPEEILELGWEEIIARKENLVIVEWAERIKDILPRDAVRVDIQSSSENTRKIVVS